MNLEKGKQEKDSRSLLNFGAVLIVPKRAFHIAV